MIYFINNSLDPYYNLAIEEVLLKNNFNDDILLLWQNSNSIIIGKNQNTFSEINIQATKKDNIKIVRRLSGGGAVYHDIGNLNFTFITNYIQNKDQSIHNMIFPIVSALKNLDLNVRSGGKNDIFLNDCKISGNAQYLYDDKLLHHGTLLYDVDLSKIKQYLKVSSTKIKSKKISSNVKIVTNIKENLNKDWDVGFFKDYLVKWFEQNKIEIKQLPEKIKLEAKQLVNQKYSKWDWNFGKFGDFSYHNQIYIENIGLIEVYLNIEHAAIKNIKFYGDFLGLIDVISLEKSLINIKYKHDDIKKILEQHDISKIFGNKIMIKDLLTLIINN